MSGEDQAALLGANTTYLSVVAGKGSASNNVGLNKAGEIRLYANKADGDGNTLTISAKTVEGSSVVITAIEITFGSTVGSFTVNGTEGSSDTAAYEINSDSVVIKNTTTGANTQVWIMSIVVHINVISDSAEVNTTPVDTPVVDNNENE